MPLIKLVKSVGVDIFNRKGDKRVSHNSVIQSLAHLMMILRKGGDEKSYLYLVDVLVGFD